MIHRFEKGKITNPRGRPKGSKDKSYLTLQYWYNELMKDWGKLKPGQRAKLSKELMQMLVNKMKALPADPKDSVRNIEEMMKGIDDLEKGKSNEIQATEDVSVPLTPSSPELPS